MIMYNQIEIDEAEFGNNFDSKINPQHYSENKKGKFSNRKKQEEKGLNLVEDTNNYTANNDTDNKLVQTPTKIINDEKDSQLNENDDYNLSNHYYTLKDNDLSTVKKHNQNDETATKIKKESNYLYETIRLSNFSHSNSKDIYSIYSIKGFNNFVISHDGKERRYESKNIQAGKDFFKYRFISENILSIRANSVKLNSHKYKKSENHPNNAINTTINNNDIYSNMNNKQNNIPTAVNQNFSKDFSQSLSKSNKNFLHAPDDKKVIKLNKIFLQKLEKSIFLFNIKSYEESFNYLYENNIIKDESEFAELILLTPGFDKNIIGQFLATEKFPNKSLKILDFFMKKINFINVKFLDALRFFLTRINLPKESSLILKIIERFSKTYFLDNSQSLLFPDEDSVYLLCSTVLALNTLISRKDLKKVKMISKMDFVRMNNRIQQKFLEEIYDDIFTNKLDIVYEYNELIYKRLGVVLDKDGIYLETDNDDYEESSESRENVGNEGNVNDIYNDINKNGLNNFGTITNINNSGSYSNSNNYKDFSTLSNNLHDNLNKKENSDSDEKTKRINHNININININYNNNESNSIKKFENESDNLNNLNPVNNFTNNLNNLPSNLNPFQNLNNFSSNFSNNFSTNINKNFHTANFAPNNNNVNNSLYESAGNFQQNIDNTTNLKEGIIPNTTNLHQTNFQPEQYLLSNSNILNTFSQNNENKIGGDFPNDYESIIKYLKRGEIFMKYGRTGTPHLKHVKLSDDETLISWRFTSVCLKFFSKSKFIPVKDLKDVYIGTNNSKIFESYQIPLEYDRFCITIESAGRTLDLRKDNEDVIKRWYYGIKYLVKENLKENKNKIKEEKDSDFKNNKNLKANSDLPVNLKNDTGGNVVNCNKPIYSSREKHETLQSSNDEISFVWKNEILPKWKEFRNYITLKMDFYVSNLIFLKKKKMIKEKMKIIPTDPKYLVNSKILDENEKSDFIFFYSYYGIPPWLRKQLYSIIIKNSLNVSEILFNKFLKNVEKINFVWNDITHLNEMKLVEEEKNFKEEISFSEENSIIESNSNIFTVKEILSDVEKSFKKFKLQILSSNFSEKEFKLELFKILRIFTIERGDLPYSKNLAYIASIFLLNSENYYKAYVLFINFICHHSDFLFSYQIRDELFIKSRIDFFENLFQSKLPKLFKHFKNLDISTSLFFYDWFEFVYLKCFNRTYESFQFYQKLFDIFVIRGEVFLYELGICLIQIQQKDLLSNSVRNCLRNLKKFPFDLNGKFTEEEILESLSEINFVQEFRTFTEENILACEKGNLWVSLLNY